MSDLIESSGIFKKNENLSKYSNFRTGGFAETLFIPDSKDSLINFLRANAGKQKITVIGGGSNLLIRDGNLEGVTIVTKDLNRISQIDDTIVAECGATTIKLFNFAKNLGFGNFEFLGCIPGTVGGACRMNAGCYGFEIKDILISLEAVDFQGNVSVFDVENCKMKYRKTDLPEDLIFLEAAFDAGVPREKQEIEKIFSEMMDKKLESQPLQAKTCGCTFKNPSGGLPPAWQIIKDLGLQGKNFGGAKFSEKHANFMVNCGNASSTDLENLINLAKNEAKKRMNIDLELEIKII
ncbi:MAG: UDP-N-acetylmuramate dehydrogenase [Rickettsiales bacterium]|jgi:UDP-N-acetylmuramate dehydrogenase|nr:UDP-N-acetylmuramate dehydrogenase [Rickettsiales bacterium]